MNPTSTNQPFEEGTQALPGELPMPSTMPPGTLADSGPPPSDPGYSNEHPPYGAPPTYGQPPAFTAFDQPSVTATPPPTPTVAAPPQSATQTPLVKTASPNSTQNTLQIAEIRDGIVIMNDGSFRAVIMVKAINFDLMSAGEQESVEYSYQGFLNSLYFPIQIFVHSQLIDLKPYITRLDRLRSEHDNMLLAMLIDDYVEYMDSLSQQANIMDKEFYVIIPFFPHVDVQKALTQSKNFFSGLVDLFNTKDQHVTVNEIDLENAKTELRNRVQAALSGLLQCGVQGLPLDTQELIELYYNIYNPDTAAYQQLKNFDQMNADIVSKGEGQASQAHLQGELPQ